MLTLEAPTTTAGPPPLVLAPPKELDVASAVTLRRGALVGSKRFLTNDGGDLRARSPQRNVRRILDVTGLAHVLGL